MTLGEQAAHWLAKRSDDIGFNDAAQRFGVSRRTVKRHWERLGYEPRAFRGEVAARWLVEQKGDFGYKEAARHFGLVLETVRQAWQRLGLGDTPRDKWNREVHGLADTAARWLVEQEGAVGYKEASQRFKLSTTRIQDAWTRLGFNKTPRDKEAAERRAIVLKLARSGKSRSQIKELVGVDKHTISVWCKEAGVAVKSERGKNGHPIPNPEAVAAGLEIVRTGGSIAEGASIASVGYTSLRRYAKIAKVKPTRREDQDPQKQARRRGRSAQAVQLIEQEGFSIGEAAAIVEIASRNVQAYLRRHRR